MELNSIAIQTWTQALKKLNVPPNQTQCTHMEGQNTIIQIEERGECVKMRGNKNVGRLVKLCNPVIQSGRQKRQTNFLK